MYYQRYLCQESLHKINSRNCNIGHKAYNAHYNRQEREVNDLEERRCYT